MLTKDQQGYLNTVFEDKITHISPFDPATQTTAGEVITEIKSVFPSVEIFYTGSSKLGIAGENDIDLLIISTTSLEECFKYMKDKYGEPTQGNLPLKFIKWEFIQNTFPVELHLTDILTPNLQEWIKTEQILEENSDLRSEYERIKLESNGISEKEYIKRKFEFWNRISGIN